MGPERQPVVVIGGGIAGLACAWRLTAAGLDALVLEAAERVGGNVRTDQADGFRFERGPHTFMASAGDVFTLAEEVDLLDELAPTRPQAQKRFIVRGGVMHAVPGGLWSFLGTGLLSFKGKWKLAGEPFRTRRGQPGETAMDFFERRFGPEAARVLAGAFISGVYAGDPASLSAPAAFPLFWRFEQESGGMIRGALKLRKQRRAERKARGDSGRPRKGLFSFQQGLGRLTERLGERLGDRCRAGAAVRRLVRDGGGYVIETDRQSFAADRVVVAVPPFEATRLLQAVDAELAAGLAAVPMAPVAVVHMGFAGRLAEIPDGFGFLAPRGEGSRSLGVLFPSRLFDDRAPAGGDLLSAFVGGMLDSEALALDDQALLSIVREDLERLTGLRSRPDFVRVARYPRAIPQLTLGHLERMAQIRSRLEELAGLYLAGNYLRGVGMKDAVGSGFEAAARLLADRGDGMEQA